MLKVIKINNFGEIDVKDSLVKASVVFTGVWCINKMYDLSKLLYLVLFFFLQLKNF